MLSELDIACLKLGQALFQTGKVSEPKSPKMDAQSARKWVAECSAKIRKGRKDAAIVEKSRSL